MVDPHLMLLLIQALGDEYVVWDQKAAIEFKKPGRGRVHSIIRLHEEVLAEIRRRTERGEVYRPSFQLEIFDEEGETVAMVTKGLHIRRKQTARTRD